MATGRKYYTYTLRWYTRIHAHTFQYLTLTLTYDIIDTRVSGLEPSHVQYRLAEDKMKKIGKRYEPSDGGAVGGGGGGGGAGGGEGRHAAKKYLRAIGSKFLTVDFFYPNRKHNV